MLYSIPQAIFLIICIWERSLKWVISEETQIKMENSLYKCVQNIWSLIYNSWNAFLLSQNCYYSKVMLSTYNVLCFLVFILFRIYYVDCITITRISTMASILNCFIVFIRVIFAFASFLMRPNIPSLLRQNQRARCLKRKRLPRAITRLP